LAIVAPPAVIVAYPTAIAEGLEALTGGSGEHVAGGERHLGKDTPLIDLLGIQPVMPRWRVSEVDVRAGFIYWEMFL
jgi:hypothetical protein